MDYVKEIIIDADGRTALVHKIAAVADKLHERKEYFAYLNVVTADRANSIRQILSWF